MNIKDQNIMVTGGAGFLGTHVVKILASRGVPEERIFIPRSAEIDLRDRAVCIRVTQGKNIVIHLAARSGSGAFHREHPGRVFYDNLAMGVNLMDAAREAGVRKFVTIGSAMEYPTAAPVPFKEDDLWMGPPDPLHEPYAVAKKMLLVQGQAYRAQYGFDAIHLILGNLYGPGESPERAYVIPMLIRRIFEAKRKGETIVPIWGTGRPTRDFLYVEDAAEAILLATERYDDPEPLNIGSGRETSVRELAETIGRLMNYRGTFAFDTTKEDGLLRSALDARRAAEKLEFRPKTNIEEGLRGTIAWFEPLFEKEQKRR